MVEKRVPDPRDWKLSADSPHSLSPSTPASIQAPWDCQLLQAGTTHSVIAPGPNPENSTHRCLIPIESSWTGLAGKQLLAVLRLGYTNDGSRSWRWRGSLLPGDKDRETDSKVESIVGEWPHLGSGINPKEISFNVVLTGIYRILIWPRVL